MENLNVILTLLSALFMTFCVMIFSPTADTGDFTDYEEITCSVTQTFETGCDAENCSLCIHCPAGKTLPNSRLQSAPVFAILFHENTRAALE